jgi:hypothetical protein
MAAAAITAAAVITACGSNSPNRPGSTGAATTTATPNGALAYARCMRAHGVPNFPDPTGGNNKRAVISAMEHVSNSRAQTAQTACERVNGGTPGTSEGAPHDRANAAAILAFARCMRRYGFASFPDPTASGQLNHEMLATAGIDLHQPALVQSADTCVSVTHGAITKATVARFIAAQ